MEREIKKIEMSPITITFVDGMKENEEVMKLEKYQKDTTINNIVCTKEAEKFYEYETSINDSVLRVFNPIKPKSKSKIQKILIVSKIIIRKFIKNLKKKMFSKRIINNNKISREEKFYSDFAEEMIYFRTNY